MEFSPSTGNGYESTSMHLNIKNYYIQRRLILIDILYGDHSLSQHDIFMKRFKTLLVSL